MPAINKHDLDAELRSQLNFEFTPIHEGGILSGEDPATPYEDGFLMPGNADTSVYVRFQATPLMASICDVWIYFHYFADTDTNDMDFEVYYQVYPVNAVTPAIVGPVSVSITPDGSANLQTTIEVINNNVTAWRVPANIGTNSFVRFEIVRKGSTDANPDDLRVMSISYATVPTYQTLSSYNNGLPQPLTLCPTGTNILSNLGSLLTSDGINDIELPKGTEGQVLKSLSSAPLGIKWDDNFTFVDSTFNITGSGDATKKAKFEVDTFIPTATTRTYTFPAIGGTLALTGVPFDAIVDSGGAGNYTTVGAAVTAGAKSIALISDTTETANIAVTNSLEIVGFSISTGKPNITFNSGFGFTSPTAGSLVKFNNLEITISGGGVGLNVSGTSNKIILVDVTVDNNGSSTCILASSSGTAVHFENCLFELPNVAASGVYLPASGSLINCEFVGGGTSCSAAVLVTVSSTYVEITGCRFTGTFDPTSFAVVAGSSAIIANNNTFAPAAATIFDLGGQWNNTYVTSSVVTIRVGADETVLNGGKLNACSITFNGGMDDVLFSNLSDIGTVTYGTITSRPKWDNCIFTSTHSITTPLVSLPSYNSCTFLAAVTVNSGVADAIFSGCRFVSTFTDNGTRTIVRGCTPESANNGILKFNGSSRSSNFNAEVNKIYPIDLSVGNVICTLPSSGLVNGQKIACYITVPDAVNVLTFASAAAINTLSGAAISEGTPVGIYIELVTNGTDWFNTIIYS